MKKICFEIKKLKYILLSNTPSLFILFIAFTTFCFPQVLVAEKKPIRIGATVSLEGKFQQPSFMVKNGYELWAEEVNRRGGILGRPVELIFYDDKSSSDLVESLYEKLITEDEVELILSPYGSTLTLAAAKVTEKHKVVMMACGASSVDIWRQGYQYIFGIYATADRYFIGYLDLIARGGSQDIGVIYENSSFNISAANGVRTWAEMFGLEVKFTESFNSAGDELPAIIKRAKENKIEELVFCGYPSAGYSFIDILKKENYRPRSLAIAIIPTFADFYERVGDFAEGVFGPSQWEADERLPFPGTKRFIRKFKSLTGEIPTYHACSAYSAGQLLEKAVAQAQMIDQEKIKNYISSLDTITIMGRFKIDHRGSQIGHNPILIQWQKGIKEIVYPTKMRTAPPILLRKSR